MNRVSGAGNHNISRRSIVEGCLISWVASALPAQLLAQQAFSGGRPTPSKRKFSSPAIESAISRTSARIADPLLHSMFEQCFPNTLDTTVYPGSLDGKPDTFVITGDIDAMWLRDSSAQVWPYLRFAREDPELSRLLEGVVRRQARMVLIDSYANAFTRNVTDPPLKWTVEDKTEMRPGVAERKWEVDSLCYVIRLAYGYWRETGNTAPFDDRWKAAAWKIVETFRDQQRLAGRGSYSFLRSSEAPSDTVPLGGYGNPARPVGMIFSAFRPSDDACIYPFLIPANLFAIQSLVQLRVLAAQVLLDARLATACDKLAGELRTAVRQYGTVHHAVFGRIFAYEVDGYGNALMMDDANVPSLLGLPYLGCCGALDPMYQRIRKFALSSSNPYFFKGMAGEGIGGPHIGLGYIWPLSITMRALTSTDDREIAQCLKWLRDTTAEKGFMHEAFQKDDPSKFTRAWFAWANTLFGELILRLDEERPGILRRSL